MGNNGDSRGGGTGRLWMGDPMAGRDFLRQFRNYRIEQAGATPGGAGRPDGTLR